MTKLISLSDAAYTKINALKQKDESFSDVVMRLAENIRKHPLSDFFGKWPGDAKEVEQIMSTIAADRKRFSTREVKF